MAAARLFYRLMLRPLGAEPLRAALAVFAIAVGVAVVLAIDMAGDAAAGSFRSSVESLAGDADFEVSSTGGLAPWIAAKLASLPYDLDVRSRIEDYAVAGGRTVPLIGLDLIATSEGGDASGGIGAIEAEDSVWAGVPFHKKPGDKIRLLIGGRSRELTVRGVLAKKDGEVLVMDLAQADRLLGRDGKLDRILVRVPPRHSLEDWERVLRAALPRAVALERQGARTRENLRMLEAFRWNLRVLSYIALVVGAFLIFNTISVSVVRRRAETGIVRALGGTRGAILTAFLGEAACFGLAGAALGIVLGRLMALGAVRLVGATVESLYVSSRPAPIGLSTGTAILGLAIGVGVSLLSALAPALEAALVPPAEAMARGRRDHQARMHTRRDLFIGCLLALAAAAAAQMAPVRGKPLFGYLSAALLIAAASCSIPALAAAVCAHSPRLLARALGVETLLASRGLAGSLRRTSVLVGALSTAIAMMAAVAIMVGSFRQTVVVWMDNQLQADFYLRPAGPASADRHPTLSNGLAARISALPGVAAVDRFRAYSIAYQGLPATLGAGESGVSSRYGRMLFLPPARREAIFRQLPAGDFAVVSEPFAYKHRVRAGDSIPLALGGKRASFKVLGIYYDYSSERGSIILDRATLLRYLPDPAPSNLAVYLKPGEPLDAPRAAIDRACRGQRVAVFTNRSLRAEAIRIFDRTFAIAYALEAVAVAVAVMGVAGALLALAIDRRRELGLLRFLGAATGQIRRIILFEAALLGLLANAAGLATGTLLSLVLVFVIDRQSFGWTIQFHWPAAVLSGASALVYAATVLSGLYPARIAARLDPIQAIHEE